MSPASDGPSAAERPSWRPVERGGPALPCGGAHPGAGGTLDESARRLSHEELAVGQLLAGEGHQVRSVAESRRGGRHADLSVCGTPVEVKSFAPVDERIRIPGPRSVHNKLADAAGQARHVVLNGTGSGLSPAAVRQGLARWALRQGAEVPLDTVRVLGDGYDLTWTRGADRRPERRPERGLGSGRGIGSR